ncbi:MAG: DNA polymerase subunit beta [Chloroflexota bacterium]
MGIELADQIAARLGAIPGVVAVAVGDAFAHGMERPHTEIALAIYYDPATPPPVATLRAVARELDERHPEDAASEPGAWGPWLNGGARLIVDGRHVDWLYRDLRRVEQVVADCLAGRVTCDYQPRYPHGFHNHIYLGELHTCRPLHDPQGTLAALKEQVATYPPAMRRAIIERYLAEAEATFQAARQAAAAGDVFYVSGCLFRGVACLVQVLYALEERYFLGERRALHEVTGFARRPAGFVGDVASVLGQPGSSPATLEASVSALARFVGALRAISAPILQP